MEFFYKKMLIIFYVFLLFRGSEGSKFSAIIAFGDSILDTGNNNNLRTLTKCNFPPYGRDFPGGIATGRFGDGKVFSDLLAEGVGVKDLLPAYLDPKLQDSDLATGVCFASGGTGVDSVTSNAQGVISATEQLNHFKEYLSKLEASVGQEKAKDIISNALFLISFGNNDIGITYYSAHLRPEYDISGYTTQLVNWSSTFVKEIYGLGARKVGFMGTLPLGCLPAARAEIGGLLCQEIANQAAQMFNSKLITELNTLNNTLSGSNIFYIDMYNPLHDIIQNPQKFGFLVANVGCCCTGAFSCPVPSTNVFWDYGHPSEKAYRIIVNETLTNNPNFS